MKTMKFCLAVCLLALTGTASAQFANSNASSVSSAARNTDTNGWQRISVSYNPTKIIYDYEGADNQNVTGFSVGYTRGFSIAKTFPLFLEAGVNATYAFNSIDSEDNKALKYLKENGYEIEYKTKLFSINIPVNLAYKFSFNNSNLSIVPYLGINFRGNIVGKSKFEMITDLDSETEKTFWEVWDDNEDMVAEFGKHEQNKFDKKETGSKEATWKRIQMGWQIGIGLNYNQLYVGVGYGKDFTELCKKTKIGTTSITLGYNF